MTQRYRLSYNGFSQDFDTLEQALPYIKTVKRWRVADTSSVKSEDYEASIRFYLDTSKLPKAMQATNTSFGDWTINSDWSAVPIPYDLINAGK